MDVQTGRFTRCKPNSPAVAWDVFFFLTDTLHNVQRVRQKEWGLPLGQRRIGPVVPADAWVGTHRLTPVSNACYGIAPGNYC